MEDNYIKINKALLPLSYLYRLGVYTRNKLFDWGVLRSRRFDIPVICVGNITVGGTGKTPHVEYLINLLQDQFNVGVLSRGYKRKSRGYILADANTPMHKIGDEPYQMKLKYPNIRIAVDADRCEGIDRMSEDHQLDVILLDDAFQHRYVVPGINILLVDYFRLICNDELLPAGRLRESKNGKNRANIVIVTKCPKDVKPMDYRIISKHLNLYPYQTLYFTKLLYGNLKPLFLTDAPSFPLSELSNKQVLLLTGIATPQRMLEDLNEYTGHITAVTFGDHHQFTNKDIERIRQSYDDMKGKNKIIITTEKDAVRLLIMEKDINLILRQHLYVLPLKIKFEMEQNESFDKNIISYVRKNKRNSSISSRENAH